MPIRTTSWRFAALAAFALLAACGGGGGGGSSTPGTTNTPTPTPTFTPTPTSTPVGQFTTPPCLSFPLNSAYAGGSAGGGTTGMSTYSVSSVPSGLTVQRGTSVLGTTPVNVTPPFDNNCQTISILGSGTPYVVVVSQVQDGPHTIFYNSTGDSSGSVSLGSLQSVQRSATSALRSVAGVTTRRPARWSGADVSARFVTVRYRDDVLHAAGRRPGDVERSEGGTTGEDLPTVRAGTLRVVGVPAGLTPSAFAARLSAHRDVAEVTPVHLRHTLTKSPVLVSDPHATNHDQWYLYAAGFPNAWAYAGGGNATIAVIDTGIDNNNPDLTANLTFQEKVVNGVRTTTGQAAQDTNGHGTNTASIAAAATNNADGFAGAGYNVKLQAYDIFPDATSTSDQQTASGSDEALAIQDAVAHGADVISLSLGSPQDPSDPAGGIDTAEQNAIEFALAQRVTVVAAAGNDADGGEDGTQRLGVVDFPAAYDGVIWVGASALRDNNTGVLASSSEYVTSYSQFGPGLGVVAPGGDANGGSDSNVLHWIWNYSTSTAAYGPDKCRTPSPAESCTALFNGTSQATPQVAALASLLISAGGGRTTMIPSRVAAIITGSADNIGDPHQGHGRINAYRALASLFGDTSTYSGPVPQSASPVQLVAFAYDNSGSSRPHIVDATYPLGVPVGSDGTFRIADVPTSVGSYRVAVWLDTNGDGIVDAGDQIGVSGAVCTPSARCGIGSITLQRVSGTYTLP